MKRFVNGEEHELSGDFSLEHREDRWLIRTTEGTFSGLAIRQGDRVLVSYRGHQYAIESKSPRERSRSGPATGDLVAPMPGQIVDVLVSVGEAVTAGQKILVLEAMKTQLPFNAPFDGVVEALSVEKGSQVKEGTLLAHLMPHQATAETPG